MRTPGAVWVQRISKSYLRTYGIVSASSSQPDRSGAVQISDRPYCLSKLKNKTTAKILAEYHAVWICLADDDSFIFVAGISHHLLC